VILHPGATLGVLLVHHVNRILDLYTELYARPPLYRMLKVWNESLAIGRTENKKNKERLTREIGFEINSKLNWYQVALIRGCSQYSTRITHICNENNLTLRTNQGFGAWAKTISIIELIKLTKYTVTPTKGIHKRMRENLYALRVHFHHKLPIEIHFLPEFLQ
jgi:hypothetical protein